MIQLPTKSKIAFVEYLLQNNLVIFEEYTSKTGRVTPYRLNRSNLYTSDHLDKVSKCLAERIQDMANIDYISTLFGYGARGGFLTTTTAIQCLQYDMNLSCSFSDSTSQLQDISGSSSTNNVVIMDDIISTGNQLKQIISTLQSQSYEVVGALVILDKCEISVDHYQKNKPLGEKMTSSQAIEFEFGIPVFSAITIYDILRFVEKSNKKSLQGIVDKDIVQPMQSFVKQYCI